MWAKQEPTYPRVQASQSSQLSGPAVKVQSAPPRVEKPGFWFFFVGILLPVVAITFETQTHFCARHFFDPLPSVLHVFLASLIPFSGALIWLSARYNLSAFYAPATLLAGMAMGIAILYSVMFMPILPLSFSTLVLGVGLFGLAPLLSVICLWRGGGILARLVGSSGTFFCPHQIKHIGHIVVLVTVLVVEFPSTITRFYLQMAAKHATSVQGIQLLRKYGSEEVMLRACYERSGRATDVLGSLCDMSHPLRVKKARDIFYKVTGKPFNSVPIPIGARATLAHAGLATKYGSLNAGVEDEFDLDTDIAGESVSTVARGLSARNSMISGTVDADALVAELTWSFSFKNTSQFDREARARIHLPHGAVVSEATLWVDGHEHKAEIQLRQAARSYYVAAVHQSKSPLLVSLCGLDSVLVQCYPVKPSQELKVKLKIDAPLSLDRNGKGVLPLPTFEERNFQVEGVHKVDIYAETQFDWTGSELRASRTTGGHFQLCGELKDLSSLTALLRVSRHSQSRGGYCNDPLRDGGSGCVSAVIDCNVECPRKITVLIDGSASVGPYLDDVKKALYSLPPNVPTSLTFVSDNLEQLCPAGPLPANPSFQHALSELTADRCQGGQNSATVLASILRANRGETVIWIHGAQPESAAKYRRLQRFLRYPNYNGTRVYDLPVGSGPNLALDGIFDSKVMVPVTRVGTAFDDLKFLFDGWSRRVLTAEPWLARAYPSEMSQYVLGRQSTSQALARILAFRDLLAWVPDRWHPADSRSLQLAESYQIVSPVSSAVVVERDQPAVNMLGGVFRAQPSRVDVLTRAWNRPIEKAFSAVSTQLNSLSSYNPYPMRSDGSNMYYISPTPMPPFLPSASLGVRAGAGGNVSQLAAAPAPQAPPPVAAQSEPIGSLSLDYRKSTSERRSVANEEVLETARDEEAPAVEAPEHVAMPKIDIWLILGVVTIGLGCLLVRAGLKEQKM